MEKIEVDNKDRPIEDIILQRARVFVDPYEEADERLAAERAAEIARAAAEEAAKANNPARRVQASNVLKVFRSGPGKYLKKAAAQASRKWVVIIISVYSSFHYNDSFFFFFFFFFFFLFRRSDEDALALGGEPLTKRNKDAKSAYSLDFSSW